MSSATAASRTAASGSTPTTTKPRSPASSRTARRIGTAKFGVQLAHAGRKASAQRPWEGGGALKPDDDPWQTIAPSAMPFGAGWHVPREATLDDIARVREAFVNAAKRARPHRLRRRSSCTTRTAISRIRSCRRCPTSAPTQYGGSFAAPHALRRARSRRRCARWCRSGVPLGARITGSDWRDDGLTPDDAVALRQGAEGRRTRLRRRVVRRRHRRHPQSDRRPATTRRSPSGCRREAGIATRTVGLIVTPKQAEEIVAEGKADMVALARALLDNPHWGWHAAQDARRRGAAAAAVCALGSEAVAGPDAEGLKPAHEIIRHRRSYPPPRSGGEGRRASRQRCSSGWGAFFDSFLLLPPPPAPPHHALRARGEGSRSAAAASNR